MEKISVTDEWLYKYMPIVDEAIIRELEDNTDYEYQFTDKFERRMKKLIRREAHPWMGVFYGLLKKTALLITCVASALFVVTMSVEAYRIKFFETIMSVLEDRIVYSYSTDKEQGTIQCKEPGYVPEGYQETERIMSEHWLSVTYTDEDGKMIIWDQFLAQDGSELIADTEYDRQIIREINGSNAVISLYLEGDGFVYYEHGECVYVLTFDKLDIEDICFMLESIADKQ